MGLYKKVQEACADNNISVTNLEKKLKFARGSIYKWDANRPSIDRVFAVAKELNKPMEFFIEE